VALSPQELRGIGKMNNFQFVFLMGSMYIIGSFLANDITTTAGIFGFGFFWLWVAILLSKGGKR